MFRPFSPLTPLLRTGLAQRTEITIIPKCGCPITAAAAITASVAGVDAASTASDDAVAAAGAAGGAAGAAGGAAGEE